MVEWKCRQCGQVIHRESATGDAVSILLETFANSLVGHYCPKSPPRKSDRIIYAEARVV